MWRGKEANPDFQEATPIQRFISLYYREVNRMSQSKEERPAEAVQAATELTTCDERTVVGVGEYVAFYDPFSEDGEETILICRMSGVDVCDTQDRVAFHSKVLYEVDPCHRELTLKPRTPEATA